MILEVPGMVEKIIAFLDHSHNRVRREACYTLSNITIGSSSQIEYVIKDSTTMRKIVSMIMLNNEQQAFLNKIHITLIGSSESYTSLH